MKKMVMMLSRKLLIKLNLNVQICLELNMINQLLFPGKVPSDQDVADLDSSEKILRYKRVRQKNLNKSKFNKTSKKDMKKILSLSLIKSKISSDI